MDLISAVVAARKAMDRLVVDKQAKAGAYSFKYASLSALLEVVVPALAEQGVLLVQDVSGSEKTVNVQTILYAGSPVQPGDYYDRSALKSGVLSLSHNGTAQEMGKAITTLRRYQLKSFLGLQDEEDDAAAPGSTPLPQTQVRNTQPALQRPAQEATSAAPSTAASLDLLRGAARKGQAGSNTGSPELQSLLLRVRNEDAKGGDDMATTPAEGKKVSMYDYMKDTVLGGVVGKGNSELVMCYIYGRIVSSENPPRVGTRFFFDETLEGKHKTALGEVRTLLAK